MDNRINQIRRRIGLLRSAIRDLEAAVRDQTMSGLDCAESATRQLATRRELVTLIGEWKSGGGGDRLPNLPERLREDRRPLAKPELKADSKSKSVSKSASPSRPRLHLK
jgi:hypothetical protein